MVLRHLAVVYRRELVQGCNYLPAIPGLVLVEAGNPVGNIFNPPTIYIRPRLLLQAKRNAGSQEPVCSIGVTRHCTVRSDDQECAIRSNPVDHSHDPVLVRDTFHIILDHMSPIVIGTRGDAKTQELLQCRIERREDRENLLPDRFIIQGSPKMRRKVFVDREPV